MPYTGATAFLRQAHRNNWAQYLAALRPGARPGWDICVLTASDERQAEMYRRQLDWRQAAGLLPHGMCFLVLPDPGGRRIGSGGATLNALAQLASLIAEHEGGRLDTLQRVLLIHSGGDSRRLPHCSATGKLFARVPRVLPDGRASTIFDEFLISLSGLATQLPPGVLIASGDVLLIFDHLQLSFRRPGVIGVAAAAPAAMGLEHGVYVSGEGGHQVRAYLHKPDAATLNCWGGVHPDGTVQIDTGLVWFDAAIAQKLVALAHDETVRNAPLNLYGDLLLPLAGSTTCAQYLADESDGPAIPAVQAARRVLWERLRGAPFTVERLQPAVFVHFGTSREYWQMAAGDPALADLAGWAASAASWATAAGPEVLINALMAGSRPAIVATAEPAPRPLIVDSQLNGPLSCAGAAIVAGVATAQPLQLARDVVLDQLPLTDGRFVTRLFGIHDDPKRLRTDPAATCVNRPWDAWLADAGIEEADIWPAGAPAQRSLWNAQLFPVSAERETSLALTLPLQRPGQAPDGWRQRWLDAPRLSLAESFRQADGVRLLNEIAQLEHAIAVQRFIAALKAETPAHDAAPLLGVYPETVQRRAELAGALIAAADPVFRLRGYKALSVAAGQRAWEDRAFAALAEMIAGTSVRGQGARVKRQGSGVRGQGAQWASQRGSGGIRVRAAARIDFGGGWTDTPPYSIERGGTVLNAAITLRGAHPIIAEVEPLAEPRLILESRDIDASTELTTAGQALAYANPADPFALHKAALALRDIVPAESDPARAIADVLRPLGCGLRLSTATTIPRGSGLGTSSILAGAVLACLHAFERGDPAAAAPEPAALFDEVLCLEQMLTTGGGWQDQVGGLTGGIKLVSSAPGLPQRIRVEPVALAPATEAALAERLVMIYTGQQRLAKDLLRAVMGRWMARDPEMVWLQAEIARLALAMRVALAAGELDTFGALLGEHWEHNKRMDPGCTNPFIDDLFATVQPYINGGKLAGAGGGGFVMAIARDREAVADLAATLTKHYPGTPVALWPCGVPTVGLITEGENA